MDGMRRPCHGRYLNISTHPSHVEEEAQKVSIMALRAKVEPPPVCRCLVDFFD